MNINANIFHEIVNINDYLEHLKRVTGGRLTNNLLDVISHYTPVKEALTKNDLAESDWQGYLKGTDGDHDEALLDATSDHWSDGSAQLNFVSENSILFSVLKRYYSYIDEGLSRTFNCIRNIKQFAFGTVNFKVGNGFFYESGLGYYTPDDLFAGIPSSQTANRGVGSGVPTERFLNYINFIASSTLKLHS